jgi:hypothetical protein
MYTTMNHMSITVALLAVLLSFGCHKSGPEADPIVLPAPAQRVSVIEREGRVRDFPCTECHNNVVPENMSKDGTKKHKDIVVNHYPGMDKCQLCHDPYDMNQLKRMTQEPVSFNASQEICGQCHGEKKRDWEMGAHGKTVGGWMGAAQKLSCVGCHNPHAPRRPTMQAMSAPVFPVGGIPKGDHP